MKNNIPNTPNIPKISSPNSAGFTLVELLLIMGIAGVLFGLSTLTLFNSRTSTALATTLSVLSVDIKNQQIKAMTGDTEGRGVPDTYGIYFTTHTYVLFSGSTYSAGNATNVVVPIDDSIAVTTTLPSNQLIFASSSGELRNYTATMSAITLREGQSGRNKILHMNNLGTIVSVND